MTTATVRPAIPLTWATIRIYIPVAFVTILIALAGFWPTYFGPLLAGTVKKVPVIHVHAAVFMGWLMLVGTQAFLAATGRIALHMKVGRIGMSYGVFLILVGLITAFTQFAVRVEADNLEEAEGRLFPALFDMIVFAPVLAAAWYCRRKPEIHKRLIVVATTMLLIAAVHRMVFLGGRPPPLPQLLLVWLSPIFLGMAYDFLKRRLVHPIYLLGIAVVLFRKFSGPPIRDSAAWRDFASWLTTYYT
jgi:hypothetical protein